MHTPVPQVLMTRAMRERLRGPRPAEAAFATIKVRFPEGISLQVCPENVRLAT